MLKNTLIKTSGELQPLPNGELTLDQMYKAIGCDTVEHVSLPDQMESSLWCDENGWSVARPFMNHKATALYRDAYKGRLVNESDLSELNIVGNAIHSYHVCDRCEDPRHTMTSCPENTETAQLLVD